MTCTCQEAVTNAYRQLRDKGVLREDAILSVKKIIKLRHSDYSPEQISRLAVEWTS